MSREWKTALGISALYCLGIGLYFLNPCTGSLFVALLTGYLLRKYRVIDTPGEHPPEIVQRGYTCHICDYDLRGLTSPLCPECGTPVEESRSPSR